MKGSSSNGRTLGRCRSGRGVGSYKNDYGSGSVSESVVKEEKKNE